MCAFYAYLVFLITLVDITVSKDFERHGYPFATLAQSEANDDTFLMFILIPSIDPLKIMIKCQMGFNDEKSFFGLWNRDILICESETSLIYIVSYRFTRLHGQNKQTNKRKQREPSLTISLLCELANYP